MTLGAGAALLIVLAFALLAVFPAWSDTKGWGYAPSGVVGLLAVVVAVLLVTGRI